MRRVPRGGGVLGTMTVMGLIGAARQVKHAGFVVKKSARSAAVDVKWKLLTASTPALARARPYHYDASRYLPPVKGKPGHDLRFLQLDPPDDPVPSELPRRVFVLWTGSNELSSNRRRNFELLRGTVRVPVELVSPGSLDNWVVPDHPLHPAYDDLSLVHRSDYLRAYLMHHHGGGYIDLKAPVASWRAGFDRAEADQPAWVTAYPESNAKASARFPGSMGRDIAAHWSRLVGTAAMIVRSHTPFTGEWLREVENRLDRLGPELAEHPGGVRNEAAGYPVSWTDLLGKVYQPLQLKYLEHIRADPDLHVTTVDYQ